MHFRDHYIYSSNYYCNMACLNHSYISKDKNKKKQIYALLASTTSIVAEDEQRDCLYAKNDCLRIASMYDFFPILIESYLIVDIKINQHPITHDSIRRYHINFNPCYWFRSESNNLLKYLYRINFHFFGYKYLEATTILKSWSRFTFSRVISFFGRMLQRKHGFGHFQKSSSTNLTVESRSPLNKAMTSRGLIYSCQRERLTIF